MCKCKTIFGVCLLSVCLFACGTEQENHKSIVAEKQEEQEEVVSAETADAEAEAEEESTGQETTDNMAEDGGLEKIEEQILVDQDGVRITATEMVDDSIWGEGVKVLVENDTQQNIGVGCNALIVNDYMITDLFSASVAAGKKANETVYISSGQLEAAGITNIGQIEIYFRVYDSDSWETLFEPEVAVIHTSAYDSMDTAAEIAGEELYAENGIRIVGQYVDENSFWGAAVLLYIENTSDRKVGINCDNMSVNGFMVTPLFSCTVYDGKKAFDDITLLSSDLEENGIETVEDIEVNFHIYDVESYDTIADTGAISFQAK